MTEAEWLACSEPDMMLEEMEGRLSREQLVQFVRLCCERAARYLSSESEIIVDEEFAALASRQCDHDAALYAYEAALKAARCAPDLREEQKQQAALLREIVGRRPVRE